MTKKMSSEIFTLKMEIFPEKSLIQKSIFAKNIFASPPNSAPGLRHRTRRLIIQERRSKLPRIQV